MSSETLKDIKQGDRVVYAIGGGEYPAIALGSVNSSYSQASRAFSAHLNLIYLNEQGTPIKVFAAPLLAVAADEEHLNLVAESAARSDLSYKEASAEEKHQIFEEKLRLVRLNPRTIGWRPENLDTPAPPKSQSDLYLEEINPKLIALSLVVAEIDGTADISPTGTLDNAARILKQQQAILNQAPEPAPASIPVEGTIGENETAKPSAEDLDAAVEEQKAADATEGAQS